MKAWNEKTAEVKQTNSALLLEGGAMRALFTAGVLDALMEKNCYFPQVMGISAGTLQGLGYISHQKGRSIRLNVNYAEDKRYMGLRHLLKNGSYFNFDFIFGELTHTIDPFDFETYDKVADIMYAIMTDAESGEPVYVSGKSCDIEEFFKVCEASCSIPLFSKPVLLRGKHYVDGGVGMPFVPLPSELPFACEKPVYILTRDLAYRKKPVPKGFHGLLNAMYGKHFPKVVEEMCSIPARYNQKVEKLLALEKEGKVFIIRPDKPVVVSRTEKDTKKLRALYEEGVRIGLAQFDDLTRWLHET